METIYLDNAATTRADPRVVAAMLPYYSEFSGNPSSIHSAGRKAREAVEHARMQVAKAISCSPEEIVFTSGGTESDNWAVASMQQPGAHLICSAVEHHALLHSMERAQKNGCELTLLPVDKLGRVHPETLSGALRESTSLVSVMAANNEVGTIQPVAELCRIAHSHGCLFHTDAVQAFGAMEIRVRDWDVDMMSLSSHKIHGPKGIGALYLRKETSVHGWMLGGAQERGLRAGTENVPGIVGFGLAAQLAAEERGTRTARQKGLRDRLWNGLRNEIPDLQLNGDPADRLPGNLNVFVPGVVNEALLMRLDLCGICASGGSACTAGSLDPSHVLLAMGFGPERAKGSIRFSIGDDNTEDEIDRTVRMMAGLVPQLRSVR